MKRKVIQIAESTQLISIPRKWSQKYGIKKGDELNIEEDENTLKISTERDILLSNIEVDLRGKGKLIHRAISSLYRCGYNEIKIYFNDSSEFELIQSTIHEEMVGFEIVEEGKNYILTKQVSTIDHSLFDSMLRRTFIFITSSSEGLIDALKKDKPNLLRNIIIRDKTINKLTNYLRRGINKKEGHFKHIGPGYVIIEILEKIGDNYRDMSTYMFKSKIKINDTVSKVLFEINSSLKDVQKLFYDFNWEDMEKFLIKLENINHALEDLSQKSTKVETILLIHLNNITTSIFYLNGSIMINGCDVGYVER